MEVVSTLICLVILISSTVKIKGGHASQISEDINLQTRI